MRTKRSEIPFLFSLLLLCYSFVFIKKVYRTFLSERNHLFGSVISSRKAWAEEKLFISWNIYRCLSNEVKNLWKCSSHVMNIFKATIIKFSKQDYRTVIRMEIWKYKFIQRNKHSEEKGNQFSCQVKCGFSCISLE